MVKALDGISFDVKRGELFGLIGPDGAGKTTLFRVLATLLNPDEGGAEVDGFDIVKDYHYIRERVGYMPGRFSLYQDLTVEENLNFFAALFGVKVEDSYDLVAPIYRQIEPFKTRRAGKLSGRSSHYRVPLYIAQACYFWMSQQREWMPYHEVSFGICLPTLNSEA